MKKTASSWRAYYTVAWDIAPDELKAEISKTLTPSMVPDILTRLNAAAQGLNGKIMRLGNLMGCPSQRRISGELPQ